MRNILLTIKYDGSGFCGWQRQPGVKTVCGTLEESLSRLLGFEAKLEAASRTDAGVHALGQRATLCGDFAIPADRIPKALNDMLSKNRLERIGEIEITDARDMPEGFHARFDSAGKRYIYKVRNAPKPDLFRRNYCWQLTSPLDLERMRAAAKYIEGEHDFACFMSSGSTPQKTTVREIYRLDINGESGGDTELLVEGNGFLYNMVRIITGTLVEVGLGRRTPESVAETIASKDRSKSGPTAPPSGLYLDEVFYPLARKSPV